MDVAAGAAVLAGRRPAGAHGAPGSVMIAGRALCSMDGFELDLPATPENLAVFSRTGGQQGHQVERPGRSGTAQQGTRSEGLGRRGYAGGIVPAPAVPAGPLRAPGRGGYLPGELIGQPAGSLVSDVLRAGTSASGPDALGIRRPARLSGSRKTSEAVCMQDASELPSAAGRRFRGAYHGA
jgi:hypothetical protein